MANILVSALLQVAVALLIAGGSWFFFRKRGGFRNFVGLTLAPSRALFLGFGIGAAAAVALLSLPGIVDLAKAPGSVAAGLRLESAAETASAVVLVAVFKTSFAEELIFRGLIAKGLVRWLGFGAGNALQALIFGAVHSLLLLIPGASMGAVGFMVAFTAVMGWFNGWLKERVTDGSILPGWVAHGTANLLAYSAIAFEWL